MPFYESFHTQPVQTPVMRKWIVCALLVSLLLHAGLFAYFQFQKLENFGAPQAERLSRPLRVFKRVTIPEMPKDQEDLRVKVPDKAISATIQIPSDKPEVTEVHLAPQTPELPKLATEKPRVDMSGWDALAKVEANSRGAMEKELNSLSGALMKDSVRSPRQPMLDLPAGKKPGDGGVGEAAGIPGLRTIDDALAMSGPQPTNKPIGMPGGALYEYDSADLKPDAIEQLQKLGELIRRNPKATFSIEGHTDSTGSPEYNLVLSERRAESVKAWLVQNLAIAPQRIQTKGLGSSRLIVPADRSVEEQQPNRRVEIVIKTNRK